MKFPYEELYYLKARGPDDKQPADAWGGYSQDFEDASCVYTHDDVEMFPSSHWLVNGIRDLDRMTRHLLVFDIDIHKAPDGFDDDRVSLQADTPVVRSQNGGLHVYFIVNQTEPGKESDFEVAVGLPFDIDIRGEFVKHHVVAPNAIPGVSGGYELEQDTSIKAYFDPAEAARQIYFDGEPALSYDPAGRRHGSGYDRGEIDPPVSLPKCYGAGLELRKKAPEDNNLNTHKVNVLTALCGLAAGYDTDTVVDLFVEEYYPGDPDRADRERTEYQVEHLARKLDNGEYDPPSVSTLQDYSILPDEEWCKCGLPKHDDAGENKSDYYDADLQYIATRHDIEGDPYEDREALLKTCLWAREEHEDLNGEKPPYAALVAVGEHIGLAFEDHEDHILGESSYNVAKRIYSDLNPSDV